MEGVGSARGLNVIPLLLGAVAGCALALSVHVSAATPPDPLEQSATLLRQGDLKGAEEAAKKAVQLHPASAEARHLLGVILFQARKPTEAADAFLHALKLKPGYAEALNDLAEVYLAQGKSAEAEQTLARAIEADPKHADSYLDLAAPPAAR
jgi:Flp pilus assembly protein TadD